MRDLDINIKSNHYQRLQIYPTWISGQLLSRRKNPSSWEFPQMVVKKKRIPIKTPLIQVQELQQFVQMIFVKHWHTWPENDMSFSSMNFQMFYNVSNVFISCPIPSVYSIFTYIYPKNQPNVGKYTSPMDPMGAERSVIQKSRLRFFLFGILSRTWPLENTGPQPIFHSVTVATQHLSCQRVPKYWLCTWNGLNFLGLQRQKRHDLMEL